MDVWDGENNDPIIFHGYTLTTKILLRDVLETIRQFAFSKSQYPLILSIENHCSLDQQKQMAFYFKSILGGENKSFNKNFNESFKKVKKN